MRADLEIGERIAKLRSERGWTQTHLAKQVGTNVKSIKDWENGVSLPSVLNLRKMCDIFSTTADYMLNMEQTPTIRVSDLSDMDIIRARSIVQVLIDTTEKKKPD